MTAHDAFLSSAADINDFDRRPALAAALRDNWHRFIATAISRRRGRRSFYDAAADPTPALRLPGTGPVDGFPRSIGNGLNADADPTGKAKAFAAAETLRDVGEVPLASGASLRLFERQQDEYASGTSIGTTPGDHAHRVHI